MFFIEPLHCAGTLTDSETFNNQVDIEHLFYHYFQLCFLPLWHFYMIIHIKRMHFTHYFTHSHIFTLNRLVPTLVRGKRKRIYNEYENKAAKCKHWCCKQESNVAKMSLIYWFDLLMLLLIPNMASVRIHLSINGLSPTISAVFFELLLQCSIIVKQSHLTMKTQWV